MTLGGFLLALADANMDQDTIGQFKIWMALNSIDQSVQRTAAEWWKLWAKYTKEAR